MDDQRTRARRLPISGLWVLIIVLSAPVALFSYRYLLDIGPRPPSILANPLHSPWLDLHVAGAATALLIGPLQFLAHLRRSRIHRMLGRVYVASCLIGGVAGFILALGSTAGPIAGTGFAALALFWIVTVTLGWRAAVHGWVDRHRAWMIRAFSLTFAAVTLRLYLLAIPFLSLPALAAYRGISFLCWVPNLAIAELYLRKHRAWRHKISSGRVDCH